MNPIDPKAQAIDHQQWLRNPTTQLFLQALQSYEQSVTNCMIRDLDPTQPTKVYHHAVSLKTLADVSRIATNTDTFLARLNKLTTDKQHD